MDDGRSPGSPGAAADGVLRESNPSSAASLSIAISSSSGPAPPHVSSPSYPQSESSRKVQGWGEKECGLILGFQRGQSVKRATTYVPTYHALQYYWYR
jgi:hypothetical protein